MKKMKKKSRQNELLISSSDLFSKLVLFKINLSGTLSGCKTVWVKIGTDILSVLIWVQTVLKCYQ